MFIGYARVSTKDQETDLQMDALYRAGVQKIYQEKTSSVGKRPELQSALANMQKGDILVVYKLDRIARSLKDLLQILELIEASKFGFKSLTEPVDTTSAVGQLMLQVLGAFAQFERSLIRERAIAGQVAARDRGVTWGGAMSCFTSEESEAIYNMRKTGWPVALLAEMLEVSPSTISRVTMRRDSPHLPQFQKLRVLGPYLRNTSTCQ